MTTTTAQQTGSCDPYARIADLDDATVATLAERFEIRASDARQHELWRGFLSRAPHLAGARVLEVGCGTGIITAMIAELPGVAECIGVDPSAGFIERARHRAPSLRFEVADGRALPFGDHAFDGLVFATTLCHVPAPELALAEARRVLRPGGYLLVYDGDYATATVAMSGHDPLQSCLAAAIGALVHDPWLVRRLTGLVRDAGFRLADLSVRSPDRIACPRRTVHRRALPGRRPGHGRGARDLACSDRGHSHHERGAVHVRLDAHGEGPGPDRHANHQERRRVRLDG
ncbi:MAG TPA: methyltransferase domain-containing protein [Pilimelia sp.]|nr:methyltransferase domain-containing protein [Pilimelia sp.]